MKSLQLYVCDYCGTQYKDKNECKRCEGSHKIATEITGMKFHACKDVSNYPDYLDVKMSDGRTIRYKR